MSSRLEAARAAAFSALTTALSGSGAIVERNRSAPVTAGLSIVMRDGGFDLDRTFFGEDRYKLRLTIEFYALDQPDTATLSATLSDFHARIVKGLLQDRTLSGTADWIEQVDLDDPDMNFTAARRPEAALECGFVMDVVTKENRPDLAPG
jgi:hypothetical protein